MKACWAAYFDKRGITWEYEPVQLNGWTPDFRLVLDGVEAYAAVKPVTEFPMDVAQRILGAGWNPAYLNGGRGPHPATPQPPVSSASLPFPRDWCDPPLRAEDAYGFDVREVALRDNQLRGNLIS